MGFLGFSFGSWTPVLGIFIWSMIRIKIRLYHLWRGIEYMACPLSFLSHHGLSLMPLFDSLYCSTTIYIDFLIPKFHQKVFPILIYLLVTKKVVENNQQVEILMLYLIFGTASWIRKRKNKRQSMKKFSFTRFLRQGNGLLKKVF